MLLEAQPFEATPIGSVEDVQPLTKPVDPEEASKQAAVKEWLGKIENDKKKWDPDFKRMIRDIDFARGYQRDGQPSLDEKQYIANITLRNINQKVATLYARNPVAEYQPRKRMVYQLWDEKIETVMPLAQKLATGIPPEPQEIPMILDYLEGTRQKEIIKKVGESLQIAYQYFIDEHDPDFKLQMKSLIRRVCTCGVGYVSIAFARDLESVLKMDGAEGTIQERAKRAKYLAECLSDENGSDYSEDSPKQQQLTSLLASLQFSLSTPDIDYGIDERLVFDWLPSTSVIPDRSCTNLKGFINARYITIEYVLPLEEVNAFFGCDIKLDNQSKVVGLDGKSVPYEQRVGTNDDERTLPPTVSLYRVLDKSTRTHFFLVEGYKNYVQEPEPLNPAVKGFWPIYALTFNDCETLPTAKATIFPPSDVELMTHQQKERNRIREAVRKHRNANAPKYVTQHGWLTAEDKATLMSTESSGVMEMKGIIPGGDPTKALAPMVHSPIDPMQYDVSGLDQDILMCVGAQEANLGPANPNGTATGQSIAEQSRNIGISSNVDDIDDLLGFLAGAGGELMLQEMSEETFKQIVGPGTTMPMQQDRTDYLNAVYLKHKAASNGRPNKTLDISNWQSIAPILQAAGANPQFMVRETIRRFDDQLDPEEAFPLQIAAMQGQQQAQQPSPKGQQKKSHELGTQPPGQKRPGPGQIQGQQTPNAQPIS